MSGNVIPVLILLTIAARSSTGNLCGGHLI